MDDSQKWGFSQKDSPLPIPEIKINKSPNIPSKTHNPNINAGNEMSNSTSSLKRKFLISESEDSEHEHLKNTLSSNNPRTEFFPKKTSDFARTRGKTTTKIDESGSIKQELPLTISHPNLKTSSKADNDSLYNKLIKQKLRLMHESEKRNWLKEGASPGLSQGASSFSTNKNDAKKLGFEFASERKKKLKRSGEHFLDLYSDINKSEDLSDKSNKISPQFKKFNFESPDELDSLSSLNSHLKPPGEDLPPLTTKTTVEKVNTISESQEFNPKKRKIVRGKTIMLENKSQKPQLKPRNSVRSDQKETIKKDDEGIKICMILEEKLNGVSIQKFSQTDLENFTVFEKYIQKLKEVLSPQISEPLKTPYEYHETIELLEFVGKVRKIGEKYLKNRELSRKFIIKNPEFLNTLIKQDKFLKKRNSLPLERNKKVLKNWGPEESMMKIQAGTPWLENKPLLKKSIDRKSVDEKSGKDSRKKEVFLEKSPPKLQDFPVKMESSQRKKTQESEKNELTLLKLIKVDDDLKESNAVKCLASPCVFRRQKRPEMIKTKALQFGQLFFEKSNVMKDTKDIKHSPVTKFTKRKSVEVLSPVKKGSPLTTGRKKRRKRESTLVIGKKLIEDADFSRGKKRHFSHQIASFKEDFKKPDFSYFNDFIGDKNDSLIIEEDRKREDSRENIDSVEKSDDRSLEFSEESSISSFENEYLRNYYSESDIKASNYEPVENDM